MESTTISPEQSASASAGIVCATTTMASAGCALGAATIIAACHWHHPFGQQLTGLQTLSFLVIPLFAAFIPVVAMFFISLNQSPSSGHHSH
jgi:hypothetical protein